MSGVSTITHPSQAPEVHGLDERQVKAEILDHLSPTHPAAVRSRRDLRIFNRVIGGPAWLMRTVERNVRRGDRVLEVGAGDGRLISTMAKRGIRVDGLDRTCCRPLGLSSSIRWFQMSVASFERWDEYDIIISNLVLHHFSDEGLRMLGSRISSRARVVAACEPARHIVFQYLFAMLCTSVGAHPVSRHDGHVSIAAGFRGGELALNLGLQPNRWRLRTSTTARGAYRFVALKRT